MPAASELAVTGSTGQLGGLVARLLAGAAAGVPHIVYTSFFGAAPDATFTLARDHYATEERIKASGPDYTFLRNNLYQDFLPLLAGDDGVIRGPAGNGALAAVARSDVARSAVAVLRDPALHVGLTYELTGGHLTGAGRGDPGRGDRPDHYLPPRDAGGGICLTGLLGRPRVAGARLGGRCTLG